MGLSANIKSLKFFDLSENGQLRLLDLAFQPFVLAISTVPFFAFSFVIWAYLLGANVTVLLIWGSFYILLTVATHRFYALYKIDRNQNNYTLMMGRWVSAIYGVAFVHGVAMTLPFVILMDKVTFEFNVVYLLSVAVGHFAFVAHLSPLPKAFYCAFIPCLLLILVLIPWTFPKQWAILFFFCIVYSVFIIQFSRVLHQFFLRQISLEEEGVKLAENYRLAKIDAEQALNDKNQFLTTASHDLRQPVHAMGFLIESIARRNKDSTIELALRDLKQSVRSVNQMFNSLLDLSKIESGKVELRLGNVYLDTLIQEITTLFSEEARAKNLEIRVRPSGDNAIARVDGSLLHQSIMNLMHNALRYTKHGGVLIAVRKRGKYWQIDVWDTGVGVAIEDQDKIYSPFYRNEHAWRIDSAGHGLGLSVVARCCEMMDCQYGFSSRLNRGSHFWLRVPALTGHLPNVRIVNETKQPDIKLADIQLTGTCLIVDDDPQVVTAWESLLSTWGVEVQCVESGKQALEVIAMGFNPRVILCDQRLRAGESGFDVLRGLLARCPAASGAMVSGEFDSPDLKKAEEEGYLVLHKPVEPEQLFIVLSRWLT